ncbi:hypothetical protein [Deinococcus pimensis]|uniref:hypothetical protein n=1 Tax=Deinococcus pimensis TaxID=309888 RepID=UPI0012F8E7E7|nr:hypothetical protein [Deinococcus pimensis]
MTVTLSSRVTVALLALSAVVTACAPTATLHVQSAERTLTLRVEGVTAADFVVTGTAEPFFETVAGTRVIPSLPPGEYTVTPQARGAAAVPPAQQADLRAGDATLVFVYPR